MVRTFTVYRRGELPNHDENQKNDPNEPQFEGVVWSDGGCVIRWCTAGKSTSVWDSFDDMMKIHGHLNDETHKTEVVWHSDPKEVVENFEVIETIEPLEFNAEVVEWNLRKIKEQLSEDTDNK